jgi:hypothetical protein
MRSKLTSSGNRGKVMKKIAIVTLCMLFICMFIIPSAMGKESIQITAPWITIIDTIGNFTGDIGYQHGGNATIVGTLSGTYTMVRRGGRFTGEWNIGNYTGSMRGAFRRPFLVGKVTTLVNDTEKTFPIVGFVGYKDSQFRGRFMAPVGPALYFWGTYT